MIQYVFRLLDQMSGPAAKIAGNLDRMTKALTSSASATSTLESKASKSTTKATDAIGKRTGAVDKQTQKMVSNQTALARTTTAETKLAAKTKDTGDKVKAATDGAIKQESALKRVSGAAGVAATAIAAVTVAAGGMALAGGQMLLDAQRYKDTTSAALTFALGTGKAAGEAMADVQRIANLMGTSVDGAMSAFRELGSAGFDPRESKILMQMVADLKAVSGGRDVALNALSDPLQALKRNEVLTVASFKGLEAAGMSQNRVYAELAKNLGVAIADPTDTNRVKRDVDRALAQRQLRGQKAVDFWSKVNLSALGEKQLGEKAKEFQDTTVTGAIDKVKNRWDSLIKSVNSGPLSERLVAILNRVAEALNPDGAGKGIVETLDKIVGMASRAYDGMKPLIDAFSSGFGEGFGSALDDLMEFVNLVGVGGQSSVSFGNALKWIGTALGELAVGTIAVVGGLAWLTSTIVEAVATLPANLRDIGRMTINGLVDGFEAMKGRLSAAVDSIKENVVGRLKSLLSIHSPSRVMAELGGYTAEGFAVGIERGAPQVASATKNGMVTPTLRATVGASGSGGRGSVTIESGAVQINATGSDVDADRLAALVEERLRALLTGSTLELGAT